MDRAFELYTGAKIPAVGLGTYKAGPGVAEASIIAAVKAGYRHIDCAPIYHNENEIGSALKKLFDMGIVMREDLFITSKLWCSYHAPEDVPEAINSTLEDLQLDYVDLYLIHWPYRLKKGGSPIPEDYVSPDIPATWAAMEQLYASGKARAIGVSNFSTKKLQDLIAVAQVLPAVNQVECHPGWQQAKLHALCQLKGIHISAFSPLARSTKVLAHPIVSMVAEKLGKTPAQVVLRWGLQLGHSVLPKSVNETRIKENIELFDWSIPEDLFAKFSEIEQWYIGWAPRLYLTLQQPDAPTTYTPRGPFERTMLSYMEQTTQRMRSWSPEDVSPRARDDIDDLLRLADQIASSFHLHDYTATPQPTEQYDYTLQTTGPSMYDEGQSSGVTDYFEIGDDQCSPPRPRRPPDSYTPGSDAIARRGRPRR